MVLLDRPAPTTLAALLEDDDAGAGAPVERAWRRAGFRLPRLPGLTGYFGVVPPAGQAPVALLPARASVAERARMLRAILDRWEDDGHYALVDAVWDALATMVREAEERARRGD